MTSKPAPTGAPSEPRTVLITGGGRGIGASMAQAFANSGDRVVVSARTQSEIEQVANALRSGGHQALAVPCDVTDPEAVTSLVKATTDAFGPVSVLINNAGIAHAAPLKKTSLDDWNRVFAVNATGTMLCMQACLPAMEKSGWGRVINIASVAGLAGARYISAYAASKHAVIGLTRSAAAEVAGTNITINAVCPGYVDTPMTDHTVDALRQRSGLGHAQALAAILNTTNQPRLIQPNEIASTVHHLCTDAAAGIHGQAIVIDGGGLQQ